MSDLPTTAPEAPDPKAPDPQAEAGAARRAAAKKAIIRELASFKPDLLLAVQKRGTYYAFLPILAGDTEAEILYLDPTRGERRSIKLPFADYGIFAQMMMARIDKSRA